MPRHARGVAAVAVTVVVGAGCSSGTDSEPPPSPEATTTTTSETPTAAPGEVAISPDGVTTAIGSPANSTEEEYFQACQAAKVWMDEQGGDPKSQIEPYLKTVQSTTRPAQARLIRRGHSWLRNVRPR